MKMDLKYTLFLYILSFICTNHVKALTEAEIRFQGGLGKIAEELNADGKTKFIYKPIQNVNLLQYIFLENTVPPKGQDFHNIEGPRCKTDRIGIVGAGWAGIDMAYQLKKLGFTDITILDKRTRLLYMNLFG